MRFFNENTRATALQWWRSLSRADKFRFANKHHKEKPFEFVNTSSMLIEKMFIEEFINKKETS